MSEATTPASGTAAGHVSYTYDNASRPATLLVGGGGGTAATYSYGFDPANRLTSIVSSDSFSPTICMEYDAANRRQALVLPIQGLEPFQVSCNFPLAGGARGQCRCPPHLPTASPRAPSAPGGGEGDV